jgi:hypothetical protein
VEGKDNKQIFQMHKQMLRDQDDRLDEVVGVLQVIKHENENFGEEVQLQTKMLTGVNQRLDKTTSKLNRMNDRMKTMINKKSTMFYYVIILIEIVAILLVMAI